MEVTTCFQVVFPLILEGGFGLQPLRVLQGKSISLPKPFVFCSEKSWSLAKLKRAHRHMLRQRWSQLLGKCLGHHAAPETHWSVGLKIIYLTDFIIVHFERFHSRSVMQIPQSFKSRFYLPLGNGLVP